MLVLVARVRQLVLLVLRHLFFALLAAGRAGLVADEGVADDALTLGVLLVLDVVLGKDLTRYEAE